MAFQLPSSWRHHEVRMTGQDDDSSSSASTRRDFLSSAGKSFAVLFLGCHGGLPFISTGCPLNGVYAMTVLSPIRPLPAALGGFLAGVSVTGGKSAADAMRPPSPLIPPPPPSARPLLWEVLMTNPPQMQPYSPTGEDRIIQVCNESNPSTPTRHQYEHCVHPCCFQDLAKSCSAVFLGEHPDSPQDHNLQVESVVQSLPLPL